MFVPRLARREAAARVGGWAPARRFPPGGARAAFVVEALRPSPRLLDVWFLLVREIIKTPLHCRSTLCYVLQNARRHGEQLDPTFNGMDPFSSAWWFDGWRDNGWREGLGPPELRTVAAPQTWLLREGWRKHGLLAIDEVPPAAAS
jgi:hypothetical protein